MSNRIGQFSRRRLQTGRRSRHPRQGGGALGRSCGRLRVHLLRPRRARGTLHFRHDRSQAVAEDPVRVGASTGRGFGLNRSAIRFRTGAQTGCRSDKRKGDAPASQCVTSHKRSSRSSHALRRQQRLHRCFKTFSAARNNKAFFPLTSRCGVKGRRSWLDLETTFESSRHVGVTHTLGYRNWHLSCQMILRVKRIRGSLAGGCGLPSPGSDCGVLLRGGPKARDCSGAEPAGVRDPGVSNGLAQKISAATAPRHL